MRAIISTVSFLGVTLLIFITLLFGLMFAPKAHAQINLGVPHYGGTGCPQGSVSTTLSPDNTQISVLFDQFQNKVAAGAPGFRGTVIASRDCTYGIPVQIPPGMSVSVREVVYRGFQALPGRGWNVVQATYGFNQGARGRFGMVLLEGPPVQKANFEGPLSSDFELRQAGNAWSKCGAPIELTFRINTTLRVPYNTEALSVIDSLDASTDHGVRYELNLQPCAN